MILSTLEQLEQLAPAWQELLALRGQMRAPQAVAPVAAAAPEQETGECS